MYYYKTELVGIWDCYDSKEEFIADMKLKHPNVIFTHEFNDWWTQEAESIGDLYRSIKEGVGDDEDTALQLVMDAVTYRTTVKKETT
jgi:hypothetical protein